MRERLRLRQTNRPSKIQLLFRKVVLCPKHALLLTLKLDLRTQNIDTWSNATIFQVNRAIIDSLCRSQLRTRGIETIRRRERSLYRFVM